MKYHALFVIFEKAAKFENVCLLQIMGGALRVKLNHTGLKWALCRLVNNAKFFCHV